MYNNIIASYVHQYTSIVHRRTLSLSYQKMLPLRVVIVICYLEIALSSVVIQI